MGYRVLDLFCGAGGAAMGLHRAWPDAEIIGVDKRPQKNYPFVFVLGDALNPPFDLREFDFIWASPPCQGYTKALWMHKEHNERRIRAAHPKLIEPMCILLQAINCPYVMENVESSPLRTQIVLCGGMFGLLTRRHRLFESNFLLLQMSHPRHRGTVAAGDVVTVAGTGVRGPYRGKYIRPKIWSAALGIDWMTEDELKQAVPPIYAEYIARQIRCV